MHRNSPGRATSVAAGELNVTDLNKTIKNDIQLCIESRNQLCYISMQNEVEITDFLVNLAASGAEPLVFLSTKMSEPAILSHPFPL